ncbi:NADPH:quinone reductase [Bdellovibrio sp. qaytius]|nr:NADPH:quinone reductase [Bdellovibrio sp. qaytius]
MKAAFIKKYGNDEVMHVGDLPKPQVGPHDVLIQIKAASINPIDFKIKAGLLKFLRKNSFPLILGHDLSGEIVKIGDQVTKFKKGDLVFTRPSSTGTFAEYIAVSEDEVALKPANISFEEAASLPLVGLTAWQAFESANLHAGQRVLIQAGAGGVGSFAIQLAKVRGAEVWTTTSEKNIDFVKSLGADHVINYKKEKVWDVLKGMDLVFDTLGGDDLYKIYPVVKKGGWIVSISGSPDQKTARDMELGAMKTFVLGVVGLKANLLAMARGIHYKFLFMKPEAQQLNQIRILVEQGKIRPVIDSVFQLADIQKGLEHSMAGRARGKIIVKIAD